MEQIQLGKADICFCGSGMFPRICIHILPVAAACTTTSIVSGEAEDWGFSVMFDAMGALSTKYNDNPETASRAFDTTRYVCGDITVSWF